MNVEHTCPAKKRELLSSFKVSQPDQHVPRHCNAHIKCQLLKEEERTNHNSTQDDSSSLTNHHVRSHRLHRLHHVVFRKVDRLHRQHVGWPDNKLRFRLYRRKHNNNEQGRVRVGWTTRWTVDATLRMSSHFRQSLGVLAPC